MVSTLDRSATTYSKTSGLVPLPGHTLIEPLGCSGFGEVWKCEAPGKLHKAVKFVASIPGEDPAQLQYECETLQLVKAVRHTHLLSLEHVEWVENEVVIVTALAEDHLANRFNECRRAGQPGIPRDELLSYLKAAAAVLDEINSRYSLPHLGVKPTNLFLTAGQLQLADYGLVATLDGGSIGGKSRGLTPRYSAPEVLRGEVHSRSDQYSLALVYQELLTGTFPFPGRTPQQLMLQHIGVAPDLSGLPTQDRVAIAMALAKNPDERFASCSAFITALATAPTRRLSLVTPQSKKGQTNAAPGSLLLTPGPRLVTPATVAKPTGTEETAKHTNLGETPAPTTSRDVTPQNYPQPTRARGVQLQKILSVVPIDWLRGREAPDPDLPPDAMVRAILGAASETTKPAEPHGIRQRPNGTWVCQFLSTIDRRVAKVKLNVLWEQGKFTLDAREEDRVIIRQVAPISKGQGLLTFGKQSDPAGLEVVIHLPESSIEIREVFARGRMFGTPPADYARSADHTIKALLEGVRRELNNFQERRKHPRVEADFPVAVYPTHYDGRVEAPLSGRCKDVSAGGLALRLSAEPATKYAYVAFEGVLGTAGMGLLFQVMRTTRDANATFVGGKYRLERWYDNKE